jgi:protoheme ferro-lyase
MERVRGGKWMTIESNEGIEVTRELGYCNMIYMNVGFLSLNCCVLWNLDGIPAQGQASSHGQKASALAQNQSSHPG